MNFDAHGASDNRNRAIGLVSVVVLHVLLVWGLMNGLARKAVELLPSPIETRIIEDTRPDPEPPSPEPEFEPPPLPSVPLPEIAIEPPPVPVTPSIQQVAPTPQPTPPVARVEPAPRQPVRVPARVDEGCPKPPYPKYARDWEITGTSEVKLLVGADGRIKDEAVTKSSGSPVLDKAALAAFKRCKFNVEIIDGVPRDTWFRQQYKWTLQEERRRR